MDIILQEIQASCYRLRLQSILDIEERVRAEIEASQLLIFKDISIERAERDKAISVESAERNKAAAMERATIAERDRDVAIERATIAERDKVAAIAQATIAEQERNAAISQAAVAEQARVEMYTLAEWHLNPIYRFLCGSKILREGESLKNFVERRYKIEEERQQGKRLVSGPSIDEIVSSVFQDSDWKFREFIIVGMGDEKYQMQLIHLITGLNVRQVPSGTNHRLDKGTYEFFRGRKSEDTTKDFDIELNYCGVQSYFNLKFLAASDSSAIREVREWIDAQIGAIICHQEPMRFFNILDGNVCHRYVNDNVGNNISYKMQLGSTNLRLIIKLCREKNLLHYRIPDGTPDEDVYKQLEETINGSIFIGDMLEFYNWAQVHQQPRAAAAA